MSLPPMVEFKDAEAKVAFVYLDLTCSESSTRRDHRDHFFAATVQKSAVSGERLHLNGYPGSDPKCRFDFPCALQPAGADLQRWECFAAR